MNKLFNKIAALSVGLAMAIGVGVAVGSKDAAKAEAAAIGTHLSQVTEITDGNSYVIVGNNNSYALPNNPTVNNGKITGTAIANVPNDGTGYLWTITKSGDFWIIGDGTNNIYHSNGGGSGTNLAYGGSSTYKWKLTYSTSGQNHWTFNGVNGTSVNNRGMLVNGSSFGGYALSNESNYKYMNIYEVVKSSKTVTALSVLDDNSQALLDNAEVNVAGSGESATTQVTCDVTYSDASHDAQVKITSNPSDGFSVVAGDEGKFTITFVDNGDYVVTIAASDDEANYAIHVTYHVTGIQIISYKKVTKASSLKAGAEFIIGKADGTFVMKKYVSGNNCSALTVVPDDADTIRKSSIPADYALFKLGGESGAWTITDQDGNVYYGTSGQNYLKANSSATDTWTIAIADDGVATITSAASGRAVKKNQSSALFATYASGQHDVAIYMIPSTDPALVVDVTAGSTTLGVGGTATLSASLINGATGTVNWAAASDKVTLSETTGLETVVTGVKDGEVNVIASVTGGSSVPSVVIAFKVVKKLSSIAVTTAPSKVTYTEGESFDPTGMVVTATFDDGSTSTPADYTYSPTGALTPDVTAISISYLYGEVAKETSQAITVNAKVVESIAIKTKPTKSSYHVGDAFVADGLVITVTYQGGSTADLDSGFVITPDTYTFTNGDLTAGSKEFTVTYHEKTTSFTVTITSLVGPIASGRYYIMNSDKTYGLNAAASDVSPVVVSLATANQLTAFDVTLVNDNEYLITTTIESVVYYLVSNTTSTSSNNNQLRVLASPREDLKSLNWSLTNEVGEYKTDVDGAYFVGENTTGSTVRYLSMYSDESTGPKDWRAYINLYNSSQGKFNGDFQIQFVPEGSLASEIVSKLNEAGLCGEQAPSTEKWSAMEAITHIDYELAILRAAEYTKIGSGAETVVTAKEGTEQVVAEAAARYDYIVGKYGQAAYSDFLGRNPGPVSNERIRSESAIESNNMITVIIVIASVAAVSFLLTCVIIKKRKEN